MEISAEKTKLTTNNTSGINTEIKVNGQKLEIVTSFKYLGSVVSDDGSKPAISSRNAHTTAALTRLKPVWNDRSISLGSKIRRMRSLVTSIFLYAVCLPFIRCGQNHLARHSERWKKTRQAEKEVGRQQQGVNGQAWSSPRPKGQWRTEKNGVNWL